MFALQNLSDTGKIRIAPTPRKRTAGKRNEMDSAVITSADFMHKGIFCADQKVELQFSAVFFIYQLQQVENPFFRTAGGTQTTENM